MELPKEGVRDFYLEIDHALRAVHTQPRPHFTNINLKNGLYFNSIGEITPREATLIYDEMIDIVKSRSQAIVNFWRGNVEHYFNRRAYGMLAYDNNTQALFQTEGIAIDKSMYTKDTPYGKRLFKQTPGREHSGCLKRAFNIEKIDYTGTHFYVHPCISERGDSDGNQVDYVNVLMHGSKGGGPPYHPMDDARYATPGNTHTWGGISENYWLYWQIDLIQEINKKEKEANSLILDLLHKYGVIGRDITYNQYTRTERETTRVDPRTGQAIVGYSPLSNTGGIQTRQRPGRRR